MTTIAVTLRDLNAALDALQNAKAEISQLRGQLTVANDAAADLMRMVDQLRAERDTWRAKAAR